MTAIDVWIFVSVVTTSACIGALSKNVFAAIMGGAAVGAGLHALILISSLPH